VKMVPGQGGSQKLKAVQGGDGQPKDQDKK
jgi:hypothetical protein